MTEPSTETETETEATEATEEDLLFEVPEVPEDARTGRYAIYNRTLGQYVGGTDTKKPTASDVKKALPADHVGAVVNV